jgi:hypothetical protein
MISHPFIIAGVFLVFSFSCSPGNQNDLNDKSIPFELFTKFERVENASPLLVVPAPEWAAAAHAIVIDDTIHYIWSRRDKDNFWDLRHSYALVDQPEKLIHDPRNPFMSPPESGMDSKSMEYPCPFYNPEDGKYYMYYLVKSNEGPEPAPKQTGLLVSEGDMGAWERVLDVPVIKSEFEHEKIVAGHTSITIVGDTIHIFYTCMESWEKGPSLCHATAPLSDPAKVTKDPHNPIFKGSGEEWDAYGVREAEILAGPEYFHIFYGGRNRERIYEIGHIRTKDFNNFEANPYNPIFRVAEDSSAWDSDGLLTPQVFKAGDSYYMLYAGLNGEGWNNGHCLSGLAMIKEE